MNGKSHIFYTLKFLKLTFSQELVFAPPRRFKFDFALPGHKIAIEYEGIFSDKSRHTYFDGYVKDCEKYNLAVVNGWRVLRYTAKNFKDVREDLIRLTNPQL